MLFDTLLEDYSPLNKKNDSEPNAEQDMSEETEDETKLQPKVSALELIAWLNNSDKTNHFRQSAFFYDWTN